MAIFSAELKLEIDNTLEINDTFVLNEAYEVDCPAITKSNFCVKSS